MSRFTARRQPVGKRRLLRRVAAAAVVLLGLPLLSVGLTVGRAAASSGVTNFSGPGIGNATSIVAGPDGALWFLGGTTGIARITTSGTVTDFTLPNLGGYASSLAVGPDGALWFTINGATFDPVKFSIGRITTDGTFTNFTDPSIHDPFGITAGPDGALWFTNFDTNSIGRITTAGAVTNFTDPSIHNPFAITAGPDGALWFTGYSNHSIGRITTAGAVTTFTDPSINHSRSITAGSDGALWFTNTNNTIGRISTAGAITHYTGVSVSAALGITSGSDGALWFTNFAKHSIGRITTSGTITHFDDPSIQGPTGIAAGPDDAMWFTNFNDATLGRVAVPPPVIVPRSASVAEGNSGTTSLNVPVTLSYPSTHTVTAQWRTVFAPSGHGNQADPASDYTPVSGTVTFTPGQTTQQVSISVNGDGLVEPNEYVIVQFGNATNASVGGLYGLGLGIILNDD